MSFGKTGAINPKASMSSMTVMKINVMAAGRDFMGKIANCRGGRVGRKIEMTQAVVAAVVSTAEANDGAWYKRLYN